MKYAHTEEKIKSNIAIKAAQIPTDGPKQGELLSLLSTADDSVFEQAIKMMERLVEYKELKMMYTCALKEIQTKFEVLNTEFNSRYQRNPISNISTRLKNSSSIIKKLNRLNKPFSIASIEENINDIAGIRIVCCYIDDIYNLADALLKQDDITLIKRKDYITNPKPNGYRSLHLIVEIPVFFAEQKRKMKVEVQIRTIAMDFWASLEHQLKYKREIPNQELIVDQLKKCAELSNYTDEKMLDIRKQIEGAQDVPSQEDILFEKISRIDIKLD